MYNSRSKEFEDRFIRFGVRIIDLTKRHKTALPFSVADQVIRSATSIGANYSEAQDASSKADFKNKLFIAKKEASETRYWLKLIKNLLGDKDIDELIAESHEIVLVFQKIINTLNNKSK